MKITKLAVVLSCLVCTGFAGSASAQDTQEVKVGAWRVRTISDPITDEKRVIAAFDGDTGSIVIKCDSPGANSTYVHVITNDYLGEGRSPRRAVIQRFDDAAPVTNQWYHDGRGAILTNNREVASFVRSLVSSSRVVIRAQNYQFSSVTVIFDVIGNDAEIAIKQVYSGCRDNWPVD